MTGMSRPTPHHSFSVSLLLPLSLLLACSTAPSGCQKTNAESPAPAPAPPGKAPAEPGTKSQKKTEAGPKVAVPQVPGVDISQLEPDEKKTFAKIITTESCACGEPHNLLDCVKAH